MCRRTAADSSEPVFEGKHFTTSARHLEQMRRIIGLRGRTGAEGVWGFGRFRDGGLRPGQREGDSSHQQKHFGSTVRLRGIEIEIESTTTNIGISKTGFHTHKADRQTLGHSSQPHFPNASRATGSLLSLRLSRSPHQSGNAGFPSQPWEYEPPPGEGGPGSSQVATPPAKAGNFNTM